MSAMLDLESIISEYSKAFDFLNIRKGYGRISRLTISGGLPLLKTSFTEGAAVQTLARGKESFAFFTNPGTEKIKSFVKGAASSQIRETNSEFAGDVHPDKNVGEAECLELARQFQEMAAGFEGNIPGRFSAEIFFIDREEEQINNCGICTRDSSKHIFGTIHCSSTKSGQVRAIETFGISGSAARIDAVDIYRPLERLASRLKESNGWKRAPAGSYPAVLDAKISSILIHETLGHALEADFFTPLDLRKKVGAKVCNEVVSLVDNSAQEGWFGSYQVDSEGTGPGKNILIEKGILRGLLHSRQTADACKMKPTGNGRSALINAAPLPRMSNLKLEPGAGGIHDFLKDMENGILIEGLLGGCICVPEKDFFWIECEGGVAVEGGQAGRPFGRLIISGRISHLFHDILGVGGKEPGEIPGLCLKSGQILPVSASCPELYIRAIEISPLE